MITKKTSAQTRKELQKKGFTLTEIAIVLGIMGLVLGAIWVAASGVYANQKLSKAETEIATIAQALRSLYGSTAQTGYASGVTMTAVSCTSGVFPVDMIVNCATPAVNNPWITSAAAGAGTMVLGADISAALAQDGFQIEMTNVPQTSCVNLLTGLAQGAVYGGNAAAASPAVANMPLSLAAATAKCPAATNNVFLAFVLKG